jgi:hypothetical protein
MASFHLSIEKIAWRKKNKSRRVRKETENIYWFFQHMFTSPPRYCYFLTFLQKWQGSCSEQTFKDKTQYFLFEELILAFILFRTLSSQIYTELEKTGKKILPTT